jgi:hypothetical protein
MPKLQEKMPPIFLRAEKMILRARTPMMRMMKIWFQKFDRTLHFYEV